MYTIIIIVIIVISTLRESKNKYEGQKSPLRFGLLSRLRAMSAAHRDENRPGSQRHYK